MMSSSRNALRKATAVARATGEASYCLSNAHGASHRSFSVQTVSQQTPAANQAVLDAAIRRLALASPAQSSLKTAELMAEHGATAGRAADNGADSVQLPVELQEAATEAAPELASSSQKQPKYLRAFPTMTASLPQEDASSRRSSQGLSRGYHTRKLSIAIANDTGTKSAFFLDTLALVRRLEAEGLTGRQAEAITHVITEVLHESLASASHTFVSKAEMQKSELIAEAEISRLKGELVGGSDVRLAEIQREVEGIRTDLDKVKSELRYEVDKMSSGQRLDLNLERGRVKEELNEHAQETSNLTNKLDREVHTLKAQLEAAKFDVISYCVGTLVSVSAVGLGMLRILM